MDNQIENLEISVKTSADKATSSIDNLASATQRLAGSSKNVVNAANVLDAAIGKVADGSDKAAESVDNLEQKTNNLGKKKYTSASAGVFAYMKRDVDVLRMRLDAAKYRLADLLNAEKPNNNAIASAVAEVKRLQQALADASKESKSSDTSAKSFAEKMKSALLPIGALAKQVIGGAFGAVTGFFRSIGRIAFYRSIRAMLKDMVQSFKDLYGYSKTFGTGFSKSMDMITTSLKYFQNSLAAMISPLINMFAPWFDRIIDKVVEVLNWVNQLFAALSGASTYTVAKKVAVTWEDTFDSTSKKAKKTTDDIKRTILGFDEINKLTKDADKGSSSGTGTSPYSDNYKLMFEQRNIGGGFKSFGSALESALKNSVSRMWMILSGASLVLGSILTFSGANPGLGIGLMVGGAIGLAKTISPYWDTLKDLMEGPIGDLTTMLSSAMLVLGFVALAAGRIPLGVGLVVGGALGIASTVPARWDRLKEYMEGPLGVLTEIISAASLVLGFVALAAGRIPLGVGLLVSGAFGLATALPARWDRLKEYIEGPIGTITAIISGASLMLGFVALAAGRIPLGVGLLVGGALGLAATLPARWDRLKGYIESPIETLTTVIEGASLLLGFVAIAAGRIPLGVGLLMAGAAGLASTLPVVWDRLTPKVKGPLTILTSIISAASLVLGYLAIAAGKWPLGIGLMVTGATGLAATLPAVWDRLKPKIAGPLGVLTGIISAASLVLGIVAIAAGNWPLGIGLLVAGSAGLAETINANWQNLVNLGKTAIEKVKEGWDTIKEFTVSIAIKIGNWVWDGVTSIWDALFKYTPESEAGAGRKDLLGDGYRSWGGAGVTYDLPGDQNPLTWGDLFGLSAHAEGVTSGQPDEEQLNLLTTWDNTFKSLNIIFERGWKKASETTAKMWTEISGTVINGLKNIETGITLKMPVYNSLFSKGMYAINSTVALAMTQMLSTYLNGLNNIETSTNVKFNSISSTVQRGWYQINANTATAMTQMLSSVLNGMNNVNTVVANKSVSIANTVASIGWNRVGNDIVYGIGQGIYDTWDWLKSVIKDLAKATFNAAKKALGINSPSKVFSDGVGKMIGLGMAQGIDNSARSVMDSMDALNANMLSRLTPYTQVGANVSGTVEYAMESAASAAPTNTDNRQQEVAVLQSILDMLRYMSENPIPAEVTASSVQRALNRSNVRAGVTTVPVGQ